MSFDRSTSLRRLADERFDVLVVGGGITGAGAALDGASRGLRVALVDKGDFASGTSSKSSKLVHGGLRYLQQREIRLVYEALAERQVLRRNAPHLVSVMPFLLPMFSKDGLVPKPVARALGTALWMYDLTGGIRIGKVHHRISRDAALAHMPTLRGDRLAASYLYYDAAADDARLTLAVARTAAEHGAVIANYAPVTGLLADPLGRITGATVTVDGASIDVRATVVVNATGVWADDIRALDEGHDPATLRPAKGIHLTVPWEKVANDVAVVVPVPKDRRSIFVVPWGDDGDGRPAFTYIGTTDTDYEGQLDDPDCTADDVAYLLGAMNAAMSTPLTEADVLGAWAGLRPLVSGAGSRTADLSRRHSITRSPSGLVTVTGGKLTTYRRMAADTLDRAVEMIGHGGAGKTKRLPLLGADGWDAIDAPRHLTTRYGSAAADVLALAATDPALARPLVPGLPYLRAEAVYAARHEMAVTLDDVMSRRTRARILARDASAAAADEVARLLAPELGWSDADTTRAASEYRAAVASERTAAGLPETTPDVALDA